VEAVMEEGEEGESDCERRDGEEGECDGEKRE